MAKKEKTVVPEIVDSVEAQPTNSVSRLQRWQ